MSAITLERLHAMLLQILDEQQATRTDMAVMMAIIQRIEGTLSRLVNELREGRS